MIYCSFCCIYVWLYPGTYMIARFMTFYKPGVTQSQGGNGDARALGDGVDHWRVGPGKGRGKWGAGWRKGPCCQQNGACGAGLKRAASWANGEKGSRAGWGWVGLWAGFLLYYFYFPCFSISNSIQTKPIWILVWIWIQTTLKQIKLCTSMNAQHVVLRKILITLWSKNKL